MRPCCNFDWQYLQLQDAPKLKAAIVGSGLAGLSTAVELLDQGYVVDIYESRPFIGGKVASWQKDGNHVEMGLHVVRSVRSSRLLACTHCLLMARSHIHGISQPREFEIRQVFKITSLHTLPAHVPITHTWHQPAMGVGDLLPAHSQGPCDVR